jgi:hypothetical protein
MRVNVIRYLGFIVVILQVDLVSAGVISGYVRDSTSLGVPNAIVYFSNTRYGCSTDSQGYFILPGLPDGHYWLTVSQSGYIRREVEVDISGPDSVHLEITILPRPVELNGVDIWADSISFDNPWKSLTGLFIPGKTEHNYTVFNSSGRIPFGLLQLDTITILYSLDTIVFEEHTLLRLWVLYANFSKEKQLFNPMHSLTLTVIGRNITYQDIAPVPYQQMKEILDDQGVIEEIQARIGGEIIRQSGTHAEIEDMNMFSHFGRLPFDWGTSLGILNPVKQQVLFKGSESAGILKPYYVHPGSGVQGYVYFIIPSDLGDKPSAVRLNEFRYFIALDLMQSVHMLSFGVN